MCLSLPLPLLSLTFALPCLCRCLCLPVLRTLLCTLLRTLLSTSLCTSLCTLFCTLLCILLCTLLGTLLCTLLCTLLWTCLGPFLTLLCTLLCIPPCAEETDFKEAFLYIARIPKGFLQVTLRELSCAEETSAGLATNQRSSLEVTEATREGECHRKYAASLIQPGKA